MNEENQLVVRVVEDGRFYITVLHQSSGQACNTIPSACNHTCACLIAHPTDAGFVLEGCSTCEVIRNYNVQTGECKIAHTRSRPIRMCHGPTGSILVQCPDFPVFESSRTGLSEFKWEEEKQELHSDKSVYLEGRLKQTCYAERFDILAVIRENGPLEAVKLGNNSPVWKLSEDVEGHVIQPDASNHQTSTFLTEPTTES